MNELQFTAIAASLLYNYRLQYVVVAVELGDVLAVRHVIILTSDVIVNPPGRAAMMRLASVDHVAASAALPTDTHRRAAGQCHGDDYSCRDNDGEAPQRSHYNDQILSRVDARGLLSTATRTTGRRRGVEHGDGR